MKIEYTIFSEETLSIIGFGSCFECDFSMQQFPGGIIVAGIFKEDEFYIKNGVPCRYTSDQLARIAQRPNSFSSWSNISMNWIDARTTDEIKITAWLKAKATRNSGEFGSFVWGGHVFDGDESAQRRINLAVMGAQAAIIAGDADWAIDWTLADNSSVSLSASDMIGVANALGANIAQAHAVARAKRQQIEQAATIEELDAL